MATAHLSGVMVAQRLFDTGLLFEINRLVLQPRGMALAVTVSSEGPEAGVVKLPLTLHITDDPEGMLFDEETLLEGHHKHAAFKTLPAVLVNETARRKALGYTVQPVTHFDLNLE